MVESDATTELEFYVLEILPVDILLGLDFLQRNGIILNFTDNTLYWKGKRVAFGKNKTEKTCLDDRFFQKLLLVSAEEVEKLIMTYRENNNSTYMKIEPININVNKDFRIKSNKYYTIPNAKGKSAQTEIMRLLEEGIIEESKETFASPIFFIGKKDGKLRLITDFRELNKFITDDVHVIPKIEEIFQNIGTSTILSMIDLANGFNQLVLDEESRKYTTFSVLGRKYQ